MSSQTAIGRVIPFYKGEWDSTISYKKLDSVLYNGSTYIALKDVTAGIAPSSTEYWQMIASKGGRGDTGSFGQPTATAHGLDYGAEPTVQITATGPDDAKIFAFDFGLPAGPLAFDEVSAHASSIEAGVEATASASLVESGEVTTLQFNFGIPGAAGNGAQSVDGVVPALDTSSGLQNVNLNAVRTIENQGLSVQQKINARANIDAQIAGNYIVSPSTKTQNYFLKYAGNDEWVTESVNVFPSGGIPGYVLKKTASGTEWAAVFPSDGESGYALKKTASGTEWAPAHEVIAGGSEGALLSKASNNNYDLTWSNPISSTDIDNIINDE